jgi:phosphopantothenate-cysteine ligase
MDSASNNNNANRPPISILITAGGTSEKIDEVRRITNSGTGRLGALACEAFAASGHACRITYLCSASAVRPKIAFPRDMKNIDSVSVNRVLADGGRPLDAAAVGGVSLEVVEADDVMALQETVTHLGTNRAYDIIVHSMAVGDYYVKAVSDARLVTGEVIKRLSYLACGDSSAPEEAIEGAILEPPRILESKISSDKENLVVLLEKAPKIISMLRGLAPSAVIVGFKLLSNVDEAELVRVGTALLQKNDCDFVLANDMRTVRSNRQEGVLIAKDGGIEHAYGKSGIADLIVKRTLETYHTKRCHSAANSENSMVKNV